MPLNVQADARKSMLQEQQEHEETKISLRKATMELEQAAAKTRTQELRQEHTDSLQAELSKAREELQELLQANSHDELTRMQQELSRKNLQCTRETVRCRKLGCDMVCFRSLGDWAPMLDVGACAGYSNGE